MEPTTTELPKPQRLTIGETPVYLKSPLQIDGQEVTQLTVKGAGKRTDRGLDSAVIVMEEKSRRRGEEGKPFTKMLDNINDMEEVDWDKVAGITFTTPDGSRRHILTKDQLSLTKPEEVPARPLTETARPTPTVPQPEQPPAVVQAPEPKLARKILETYSGTPTTLTIVGLKAYETRAHDLADKAMQLKTSLGERIWKQGFGPVYFHEKLRQYYLDMLKASTSPFAAESIRIAEAAGTNRYQELLKNKIFLTRWGTRFVEWATSNLGMRTLVQKFALEEIAAMRERGEIKEREVFDREAGATRKRFEADFDNQDEYIRKTLGEDIVLLDQPEHKPLVDEIKTLVRGYASGEIATKADFDTATDALFQTHLKRAEPKLFEQAELYTSSLYEVAENLRTKANHEGGLAAIDAEIESMQVRLGMGVMGEATALEPTDVQRGTQMVRSLLTKLEKKGIVGPFLFNEATVASGVAAALSLAILPKVAVSGFARTAGGFAGGVAAGALFGGWREYRQLEREYLTHLREREAGLTFSPDAKRRAWMERFFVGQRGADDLIASLTKEATTEDDLRMKLAHLADAKARKALSAREHERRGPRVGLIQFSGRENIESERTALDMTIAQAEKDIAALLPNHPDLPDLEALTAAQTRILNEGLRAIEGLDDPIKVTLGLLEKYNPEVDVMRRRFPLLGPEAKTGAKAQGLEDIFKEFRRAARGAAVRKGLVVGATGALIGLGIREALQLGMEIGGMAAPPAPEGFSPPESVMGTNDFQFSDTLQLDGGNIVDRQGHVIAYGFKSMLSDTANFQNGELTEAGKQAILDAARQNGYDLEIPAAVKTTFAFSGNTYPMPDLAPGHLPIAAPQELHWQFARGEGWQLVLDAKDASNNPIQQVLYTMAERPGAEAVPEQVFTEHPFLSFIPEQTTSNPIPPLDVPQVPGLPGLADALGADHFIKATIPQGTELIQDRVTGTGEHIYRLVDASDHKSVLLDNIQIETDGHIANIGELRSAAAANGMTLDHPFAETVTVLERGPMAGTFEKAVSDMGGEHGASGPWGWLEDPINADRTVSHALPGTNLAKNLFRGFQENYLPTPEHANYTTLNPEDVYHNLPKALFEDGQLVKLGHIMDEAIKMKEVDGTLLKNMDPLHRAAYEIGRVGRVATKAEVQMFLDALGGGEKETTVTLFKPVISQTLTEVLPAKIEGIDGAIVTNVITLPEAPEIPLIPIPILWRRPLEPYKPLEPYTPPEVIPGPEPFPLLPRPEEENPAPFLVVPYGPAAPEGKDYDRPYGPKYTDGEILAYYRGRTHPDLQNNPDARIDFISATRWYIDRMPTAYKQALEALDRTIASPMHEETKIAVCLPVAAHQEGGNIYHTLEQYTKQTDAQGNPLERNQYEVLLFLNIPEGQEPDKTLAEVRRFIADHPDMPVRVATGSFPPDTVRFGAYIKYAYDLALLRAAKRTSPANPDLLIATADADLEAIDPAYLATAINQMNSPEGQRLDAMLTLLDFDTRVLDAFPTLKAAVRFGQYVEHQMHEAETPYVQTSGAVSVLRGSTLAAVGGVNPSTPAGADIEIGRMIHYARHGKIHGIPKGAYTIGYNNTVGIRTNARRQLVTHLSGRPLIHTWDQFDEGEDVRGKNTLELIALGAGEHKEINPDALGQEINAYRQWDVAMDSTITRQALSFMGLEEGKDYVLEEDPEAGGKRIRFVSDLTSLKARIGTLPPQPPATAQYAPTL